MGAAIKAVVLLLLAAAAADENAVYGDDDNFVAPTVGIFFGSASGASLSPT